MVRIACINAVKTVTCPRIVTGLQGIVTEDVNQDGKGANVIRVCLSSLT